MTASPLLQSMISTVLVEKEPTEKEEREYEREREREKNLRKHNGFWKI